MKVQTFTFVQTIMNVSCTGTLTFFLDLGLEMLGETKVEGEWMERMIRVHDVQKEVVMLEVALLRTPDGETNIELIKFHMEADETDIKQNSASTQGVRHIAFAVEDLEALVTKLKNKGAELIGEIQNYENAYKLCFIRGPEGIILELAEEMK